MSSTKKTKLKLKCIDDSVNGLTLNKEYYIFGIYIRKENHHKFITYAVLDDYETINEYSVFRFEEALIPLEGIVFSCK